MTDPITVTSGLPRPILIGTAHYHGTDGLPRTAPIYEPGPATNGQRIQAEDIGPGWVLDREEALPAPPVIVDESAAIAAAQADADAAQARIDAARTALANSTAATVDELAQTIADALGSA